MTVTRRDVLALTTGAAVGALGGLIGLGGAEFRLPLLISVFGLAALPAVILNKAMSLVVVAAALPARSLAVPWDEVLAQWPVALTLLSGSLIGAWVGATWAVRMRSATLYRVLAALLVVMAVALVAGHLAVLSPADLPWAVLVVVGPVVGFGIGVVAALMGVAGGELLIPTITLLYGVDIRVAGSVSLVVSLPTMLMAFSRYARDGGLGVIRRHARLVVLMATGSVLGTLMGAAMLGVVPDAVLVPILAVLLVASAVRVAGHARDRADQPGAGRVAS